MSFNNRVEKVNLRSDRTNKITQMLKIDLDISLEEKEQEKSIYVKEIIVILNMIFTFDWADV